MEFTKFTAGYQCYGSDTPKKQNYELGVTNVNFDDEAAFEAIKDKSDSNHQYMLRMREALGLCHAIIIENKTDEASKKEYLSYNASSPDELALVNGARYLGFEFFERDAENNLCCKLDSNEVKKYELLYVLEFDSTRKRMSVIVRTQENKLMLICKGADSIIEKRLIPG